MFEDIHNRLFGSIGSKIKTLAKLGVYIGMIGGLLITFLSVAFLGSAYSQVTIYGLICAILSLTNGLSSYGFGELIEKVSFVADRMEKIEAKLSPAPEKRPSGTKEQ